MGLKRLAPAIVTLALAAGALPPFVPQALAFPHRAEIAGHQVWSERPIDRPALTGVLNRANALVAASPIAQARESRRIFLTEGGWRWHWLALNVSAAMALTRPVTENVVVNVSDPATDRVTSPALGTSRKLSGVIAHEITHGMLRRRYGILVDMAKPQWLREGYADYVAQDTTLTAAQAAELEASNPSHPALPYYHGRQRVADLLEQSGGSVDALFRD